MNRVEKIQILSAVKNRKSFKLNNEFIIKTARGNIPGLIKNALMLAIEYGDQIDYDTILMNGKGRKELQSISISLAKNKIAYPSIECLCYLVINNIFEEHKMQCLLIFCRKIEAEFMTRLQSKLFDNITQSDSYNNSLKFIKIATKRFGEPLPKSFSSLKHIIEYNKYLSEFNRNHA